MNSDCFTHTLASTMSNNVKAIREVYAFPDPTFIENVAVRSNGHLLLTTFREGSLYDLDPNAQDPMPQLVAKLPAVERLTGIVEFEPDVFVVTGAKQAERPFYFVLDSAKAFIVDLRPGVDNAAVEKLVDVPGTEMLNGMAGLPENPHILLSLDSIGGRLFRIDARTAELDAVLQHTLLGPSEKPDKVPLGANGAKIRDGYLYFTNSAQEHFSRIKIGPAGDVEGEIEVIWSNKEASRDMPFDDFDFDPAGNAYVTMHPDTLCKITPDGELTVVIADYETLKDPTAVASSKDGTKAYVVTAGVLDAPIPFAGSQVVEVQLADL